ncbi:hypothetical protein [Parachryseolinea silvisoli]|uniref:hypothetical protein n=1 Tax=Parachryseolinea silvisoli TaxID=2873601 RepID=UPI0022659AEF|nr:hypothetical protein [Parachryseolinea silvisoli]MCD9019719.1 hypothetical protein [Parachryseolinea silvisoli]
MKQINWTNCVILATAMAVTLSGCKEDESVKTAAYTEGISIQMNAPAAYGKRPAASSEVVANVYVLDGKDTIYSQLLKKLKDRIAFHGDEDKSYSLVVKANAFQKVVIPFTMRSLQKEKGGRLVNVNLVPALTFVTGGQQEVQVDLGATDAALSIDWGDGSPIEATTCGCYLTHLYDSPGYYFVSIAGELDKVETLGFFYEYGNIADVALDHVANLVSFGNAFALSPTYIDFSANTLLQTVELSASKTRYITVPADNDLLNVRLFLDSGFSATSLNNVIHQVYMASLAENRTSGQMYLSQQPFGSVFIAPISNTAKDELRVLRDSLAWEVWPDQF